ncbi:hypothetical protein MKX01_030822 [Papaver californicum]|nr:hypothetical protein MKX01_030822 [Papaver californicum]
MCIQELESLITYDPSFIRLHRSKSHPQLFIMMYKDDSILVYTPKYEFQGGEALYKSTIPWSQVAILKPINGLFCFVDILHGLSCVYSTNYSADFHTTSITDRAFAYCSSFYIGENEWKTIDELSPVKPFGKAVYTNGSIYWRNCGDKLCKPPDVEVILAFNVGTEKFRVIPIPDIIVSSHRNPEVCRRAEYLLEVDGHIAVIDKLDKNVVMLWRSDDDYRLKTELTWLGQTIKLPFECSFGERFSFFMRLKEQDRLSSNHLKREIL